MAEPLAVPSLGAQAQPTRHAPVLLPTLVDAPYDYAVPSTLPAGSLVHTIFARRPLVGVVWDGNGDPSVPASKIKPIGGAIDLPPLSPRMRRWLDWVADYTLAPRGMVLALCGLAHAAKTPKTPYKAPVYTPNLPALTPVQQPVAQELARSLRLAADQRPPILLDGVTGSGKTEVYFHTIAETLAAGKQVLVLLPEIALTHQWLERFKQHFGAAPGWWHSKTTPAHRRKLWQAVARGDAKLVVGARSALFLPFCHLGLIVVDEEHDPSYKQADGVQYHARDMAVARARYEQAAIVLVSATPSLETLINVEEGKYRALRLPTRFGAAGLPQVDLVDMRAHPPERGSFLSSVLIQAMVETIARGEQVLLFLNRRGYAPLLLCRACGHRFQCSDCSAWLVVHGKNTRLECHHCGHRAPMPTACPACEAPAEKLAACGPGVERIAEEVRALFPPTDAPPPSLPPHGGRGIGAPPSVRGEAGRGLLLTHPDPLTRERACDLRKILTEAEKKLWYHLRRHQLGIAFRKQFPIGPYIADFACVNPKIIIELDGGQHTDLEAMAYDKARTEFFEAQGFTVLRFFNDAALREMPAVLDTIRQAIDSATAHHKHAAGITLATLSSDETVAAQTWAAIERGEIDIMVGTQMVAKGHHFPRLTLVGVIDADVGLQGADLRAGERTYQLLHQLGGRAGRGEVPGRVLIQTYQPQHPIMQALRDHDRDAVMALERDLRREGHWPPYGQLVAILLDGTKESDVQHAGRQLAQSAPADARLRVLGPAPAPLSRLRGQYRYRLLVKVAPGLHLQRTLRAWLKDRQFKSVRITVDVNPYYFL